MVAAVKSAGYLRVALDLEGFRSGNLNDGVAAAGAEVTFAGATPSEEMAEVVENG